MPQVGDSVDLVSTAEGAPLIRRQGVVRAVEAPFVDVEAPFTGSVAPLRFRKTDMIAAGARHWKVRQDFFGRAWPGPTRAPRDVGQQA